LSEKEKSSGTSSAPFCDGNITAKTMKRQKIQKTKDKRVDVSGSLKRRKTVGNIDICKSQTRRKLLLLWNQ